jgi:hypothetical protein
MGMKQKDLGAWEGEIRFGQPVSSMRTIVNFLN